MDRSLSLTLENVLTLAYPESWRTEWLCLPLEMAPFAFHAICSDLPLNRSSCAEWPPSSKVPEVWVRWAPEPGRGFWVRPRRNDPLLRDRFIMMQPNEPAAAAASATISLPAIIDACRFAAASGRLVWHNPSKGGARFPHSAHFQSMPMFRDGGSGRQHTLPCCGLQLSHHDWGSTALEISLLQRPCYPILGLVAWGGILEVAELVWSVIDDYDHAQACNLIVQPFDGKDSVRAFVFPRSRMPSKYSVTSRLLRDDERLLMQNCRGGRWSEWPFAGVEMGLLTQVEWCSLFEDMQRRPEKWGESLQRLARDLSLGEADADWGHFRSIVETQTSRWRPETIPEKG